jgi:site-specific recombinase XerD
MGNWFMIDVDPQIIALLRELRLEQSKKALSQYVFTQEGSPEPIHPQSPARYLQNFARKYGVQGLHPHKLRHSFASIAITNGADIASVSEKLGHTDKAVTLRMYTHADQESIKRASQIFRDAIKQA